MKMVNIFTTFILLLAIQA